MADTNVNGGTRQATGKLKSVESLDQTNEMERGLSNRHVQFIAIGGTIGTGLFLGSGKSISLTGPSIIFVYILVGVIMFFLMRAIGEMMYRDPSQHTFINFITRYLGNGWGHFAGWTYWAALVLLGMTEITAVSTYFITFFDTFGIDLTHWKWLIELCFLVSLVSINLIAVKVFGEVEFWFSMIKITLICAMIATAVVMIVIGYHYPAVQIHGVDHVSPAGHAGFDNLFANFSFAPNGWMAFLMSFQMVFFAYEMIEFVGVTVSETKNPRKVLPKAINEIIVRVLIFYVGALVAIMCITPWSDIDPETSPFVHTFVAVGIPAAASIVNFVVLTSAASSANSGIYSTSRMLYGLSLVGVAPKAFGRLSSSRVPANGLLFSCLCLLIGASMLIIMPTIMAAFTVMTTISSVCFIFVWSMILYSYVVYRKRHPERHETSKFKLPGGVFSCWICWIFFAVVLVLLTFEADTRMAMFTTPIWFIILGIGYFMSHKNHVSKR